MCTNNVNVTDGKWEKFLNRSVLYILNTVLVSSSHSWIGFNQNFNVRCRQANFVCHCWHLVSLTPAVNLRLDSTDKGGHWSICRRPLVLTTHPRRSIKILKKVRPLIFKWHWWDWQGPMERWNKNLMILYLSGDDSISLEWLKVA